LLNKKILIVDDQYGIRVLLDEVFRKEGYQTYQAANGKQALALADEKKPDLVILDMKIPGMDGLEILKRIKILDKSIQVIMITAYGELDLIQEAMQLGALTHFTKPFDIDELRIMVDSYLTSVPR
jgi:two-component system response regulator (stage 0 sporulation protein F)